MIAQIPSFLIIAYLLLVFPVLFGSLFIKEQKKEVTLCYLYGMTGMLAVFLLTEAVFLYFRGSFSALTAVYAVMIGIISVCAMVILVWKRTHFELPQDYRYHYLAAGVLVLIFTVFRQDSSADSVLETAMTALYTGEMYGYSPYTGQALATGEFWQNTGSGGMLPVFYAALAKLSGVHVTIIGKLILPFLIVMMALTAYRLLICRCFGTDKKRSSHMLWLVLFAWIFICFREFAGYRLLWEAPWTPESLIFYCLAPFVVSMFLEKKWNRRFSVLFASAIVALLLLFPIDMWRRAKGILLLALVFLIFYMLLQKRSVRLRGLLAAGAVLAALSVLFHGCIITDSRYGVPDNRYKMDVEIMQVRMLLEPVTGEIKMLAPPQVCAQIRDADFKINLLLGPDALDAGEDAEGIRLKEIAKDLALSEYEPIKLIQHARAENCNYVVSCKETGKEMSQEELFFQYGFSKVGETTAYAVYEFMNEDYSTAPDSVVIE